MSRWIVILLLLSGNAFAELDEVQTGPKDCVHDTTTFRCVKFLKNYDADTITVEIPNVHPLIGHQISVRVRGLDAAEMKGKKPCEKEKAREAQDLVEKALVAAKRIDLQNIGRDKFFRIDADVVVDGKHLKDILTESNLVVSYNGGTKAKVDWCKMGKKRIPTEVEP